MKPNTFFLGFLDRFSLRQLLTGWMAVVLIGCSSIPVAYWWVYQHIQIQSLGVAHQRAEYELLALTAAGVLLAMVLGLAISRSVTRQVRGMAEMARHLELRDFKDHPVKIPKGDLGDVVQAFLDMRKSIIGYEIELREREAEARAGNRAKSAFLAAMSHEVRTPLLGINGMIEVLSMGNLDEDQRQDVDLLHLSAQSLLQIIGDILDFSKIEAGKMELVPETISVLNLVEASVAHFNQTASSKGLRIRCDTSHAVGPAHRADPLRLQQILNNFLSNAVKFTHEGQITVRVRCLDSTADADRLVIEVQDTGIGVSEENQAKLFQPFSQAEISTTRRFGGTGLGLAICRHLGELMGGEITMRSAEGKGTTMAFTATYPIGDIGEIVNPEPPDRRKVARFIRPRPSVEEALMERSLILLAEDHPTNRAVLTRQLNLAGFALELAEDGQDALEQWKSGRHALVFTDLHMPRLDGYQLTSAMRHWERVHGLARTPVIALTANVLQGEAERCLEQGMDDYLTKPVSIPVLVAKLRQWLPHLAWLPQPRGRGSLQEDQNPVASAREHPGHLDNEILLALGGNDPAAAHEILEDFRSATQADLMHLIQFFDQGDLESFARQAYRIKGASAMVGARALAQLAKELEKHAKEDRWDEIRPLLRRMQEAIEGLAIAE
jgi:signal transduction histidine kinase/CheY-like chemotaxis protein/HPt (histidine-containing phosphotransfer) domain-containing protein